MAFNEHDATAVLFGGLRSVGRGRRVVDDTTWVWDGVNWTAPMLSVKPPLRYGATLAYDAWPQRVVLFGGCANVDCSSRLNDTWTWDGNGWRQESPAQSPAVRDQAAMAWMPALGSVILFGGRSANGNLGDMWSWDGGTWTPLAAGQPAPEARYGAGLAWSAADAGLLLYGGMTTTYTDDTWVWKGGAWRQIQTSVSPAVTGVGMVYSRALDAVVLVSRFATWVWGGE